MQALGFMCLLVFYQVFKVFSKRRIDDVIRPGVANVIEIRNVGEIKILKMMRKNLWTKRQDQE